nr:uncharacterized protein LOC107372891 isoform X3 [Nothobranchius furzeri]XP_054592003.1 uncharacterized protein LOC107372891 isoform X3 [Nothobranchius furzeri]
MKMMTGMRAGLLSQMRRSMATFDLHTFVAVSSHRLLESCRKADLQQVAAHFSLPLPKQLTKVALRKLVVDYLETQGILPSPSPLGVSPPPSDEKTGRLDHKRETLDSAPPSSAECSSQESDSSGASPLHSPLTGARIKLRLARLKIQAEERAHERRHELGLKRMDTKVRLRQLELQLATVKATSSVSYPFTADHPAASSPSQPGLSREAMSPSAATSLPPAFDVSKCISLLPPFRETEVNGYFPAFKRIAVTLQWPREVWSLLLQCRLSVAQNLTRPFKLEDYASQEEAGAVLILEDDTGLDPFAAPLGNSTERSCSLQPLLDPLDWPAADVLGPPSPGSQPGDSPREGLCQPHHDLFVMQFNNEAPLIRFGTIFRNGK